MTTVRPELLAALIQQESGGDHNAVSPKGARGLTQVMPATATDPGFGVRPLQNNSIQEYKRFTNDYLGAMLDRYHGNEALALAAYNAGPGAVDRYGAVPPFKETQNYVSRILKAINPIGTAYADELPVTQQDYIEANQAAEDDQGFLEFQRKIQSGEINEQALRDEMDFERFKQDVESGKIDVNALRSEYRSSLAKPDPQKANEERLWSMLGEWNPEAGVERLKNVAGGALKGASNIGATLIRPFESSEDNQARRAQIDAFMQENFDPESVEFGGGRIGTEIAGTAGIPLALGKGVSTIAPKLGAAIATGGFSQANPITRLLGGAISGGAMAGLVNPENAKSGAAIGAALPGVGMVAKPIGNALAEIISGAGTHTGSESIKRAASSGYAGGQRLDDLLSNMRGSPDELSNVVDDAMANLRNLTQQKQAQYASDIASTVESTTPVSVAPIKQSLANARQEIRYLDDPTNLKADRYLDDIEKLIKNHEKLIKKDVRYSYPMGIDALKRKIDSVLESIPYNEKVARRAVGHVFNDTRQAIINESPQYAEAMKNYWKTSEELGDLSKALSLKDKTSTDTILRKLQSTLRNNANTNFGQRVSNVNMLESGGFPLMDKLAGQALNTLTPRGIANATFGGSLVGGYALGNLPGLVGTALFQSPRIMGEAAVKTGQLAKLLESLNSPITRSFLVNQQNQ